MGRGWGRGSACRAVTSGSWGGRCLSQAVLSLGHQQHPRQECAVATMCRSLCVRAPATAATLFKRLCPAGAASHYREGLSQPGPTPSSHGAPALPLPFTPTVPTGL